jgi:hypothetical protein
MSPEAYLDKAAAMQSVCNALKDGNDLRKLIRPT